MKPFIGIDGCKAGWFAVMLDEDQEWDIHIFHSINDIIPHIEHIRRILIDIPIGLPEHAKRVCDQLARQYLTRLRSSSVFPVPTRPAVYAEDYTTACEENMKRLGVKLSKQSWNIRAKIIEVDQLLTAYPQYQAHIRESHPEIAFWALAKGKPMKHYKRSTAGITERLALLKSYLPACDKIYRKGLEIYPRKDLGHDDIIDAIALATTALTSTQLVSIPQYPEKDAMELPMEIVHGDYVWDSPN